MEIGDMVTAKELFCLFVFQSRDKFPDIFSKGRTTDVPVSVQQLYSQTSTKQ